MASPQLEDGYTRIANDLFDAVLAFDFSKRQGKIVYAIIRKTYGFNKKSDVISLSQFVTMTGLDKGHASKTLAELFKMGVIKFGARGDHKTIGLNKDYGTWEGLPKQQPKVAETATPPKVAKTATKGCQNSNEKVAKTATTKDKVKTNKDNTAEGLPKQQPGKTKNKEKAKPVEYPEWLDREAWADFKAHRIEMKKPMTPLAETIGIKKLDRYRKDEPQREIINRSIFGRWQDLYPAKDVIKTQGQADRPSPDVFVSPRNQGGKSE